MTHFVLVHAAWQGAWAWRPVRTHLEAAGHTVSCPTLPGLGADDDPTGVTLQDCVDALVRHVQERDLREIVLVAHSWGGIVAGGATPSLADRIRHLVMFSAFVPQVGQSLVDLVPASHVGLFEQPTPDTILPPLRVFQELYMDDVPADESALAFSLLQPHPLRTFVDPLTPEMDFHPLDIRKTYLAARDDHALPPQHSWVPRFSDTLGGALEHVPGSHQANLTQPAALAEALVRITR